MHRKTKIVATLGPASSSKASIRKLIKAGMNVARLNFSHGTYDSFKELVKNVRELEVELKTTITLLQDLQGPKIRLGELKDPIAVEKGQILLFSTSKADKNCLYIPENPQLTKYLKKGHALLIEDGLIRTKILSINGSKIKAEVLAGGLLKSHKGINIPDTALPNSVSLTKKDRKDLEFGLKELKVDAVAISFVEDAKTIVHIKKKIRELRGEDFIAVIAKIERKEALNNLEAILGEADGLMVARGDLGIETEAVRVPIEQKRILTLARRQGKPVIVATQILQSMVENPIPTRAEVSDAANAVFEHADAIMLSNESAVGQYPEEAVRTLSEVALASESAIFKERELFPIPPVLGGEKIEDESMALNACRVADEIDATAMVVLTKHSFTARAVLKHRPKTPVIIVTPNLSTARFLNMLWGSEKVIVYKGPFRSEEVIGHLVKERILKIGMDVVSIKLTSKKRSLVVMHTKQ